MLLRGKSPDKTVNTVQILLNLRITDRNVPITWFRITKRYRLYWSFAMVVCGLTQNGKGPRHNNIF